MPSRIAPCFEVLKKQKKKALVTFLTAGDPDLETTQKLVLKCVEAGADIIELGIPFSDPMADGPVIQRASERALLSGTSVKKVFDLVSRLRQEVSVPIVLMGYFNPIFQMGCATFCKKAAAAGVDGLIVVDLPPEESEELHLAAHAAGLDLIYLLTPTSNQERIEKVEKKASGFIYYVSMTGITGASLNDLKGVQKQIASLKKKLKIPICVGFGIQSPDQAAALAKQADGVVVGSALVRLVETAKSAKDFLMMFEKVRAIKEAIA